MSRYVDAEKLFLDFQTDPKMRLGENLEYVRKTINKQATADVRENVHGEWVDKGHYSYCSVCDYENPHRYNFCPKCGADMRKEVEE